MRLFGLVDFQHAALALGFGLLALALAAVAWCGYDRGRGPAGPPPEDGSVPVTEDNPVPPVLVFVFWGVAACALGYAATAWLSGAPVGF